MILHPQQYNYKPKSIITIPSHYYNGPTTIVGNISLFTKKQQQQPIISIHSRRQCHINNARPSISDENTNVAQKKQDEKKSFWGAVSLIIGTAVGPGMLGLPAATMKAGPLPSTISIIVSWVYVISSIILVAELSFATMEEDGVSEVSFTTLATKALGTRFGAFVALVYASLSFSLLIACVSGIGSIVFQLIPTVIIGNNNLVANSLFPLIVGIIIMFFPFAAIDTTNRFLCILMLVSITALVSIGLSIARASIVRSFSNSSWSVSSILPAMPVTVLTLGFHVITPFICRIAGNTVSDARKAILVGGVVPLIMVLSWNIIVLGLNGTNTFDDPISLLLSVNPSAMFAVQAFALSALATSLIGYAVSFPKQLLDTWGLMSNSNSNINDDAFKLFVTPLMLSIPVLIATQFRSTFSKALDFAGVYANCFLFGLLPPAMAYIYQSRKKLRPSILPGGGCALLLLFIFAIILAVWH